MYQLKTCFITTKHADPRCYKRMEYGIKRIKERIKIGSKVNLLMFSFNLHIVLF